jgi:PKD repeat protein
VNSSTNPIPITITENQLITATFTQNDYAVIINTVGGGSVTRAPDQPTYHYGAVITLTAVPLNGWTFSAWSGAVSGNVNPITTTINADQIVTATFTQNDYTLTVNTVGNGTVSRYPDQSTYHSGDVITLTALPAANWAFTNWSGDLIGTANPAPITITGHSIVTATFNLSTACLPIVSADFSFTPTTPRIGQSVNFTAAITGGTLPVTYTWNFGDGGQAITTTASLQHSFPLTNVLHSYTVMLMATNTCSSQPVQKSIGVRPYGLYLPLVLKNL